MDTHTHTHTQHTHAHQPHDFDSLICLVVLCRSIVAVDGHTHTHTHTRTHTHTQHTHQPHVYCSLICPVVLCRSMPQSITQSFASLTHLSWRPVQINAAKHEGKYSGNTKRVPNTKACVCVCSCNDSNLSVCFLHVCVCVCVQCRHRHHHIACETSIVLTMYTHAHTLAHMRTHTYTHATTRTHKHTQRAWQICLAATAPATKRRQAPRTQGLNEEFYGVTL
jgi:hypothetical protein